MRYLVDTDWLVDYLAGREPALSVLNGLVPEGIAISTISLMEILEGIVMSNKPAQAKRGFDDFLHGVDVISVNRAVARRAACIRGELRQQRRSINDRALDLIIAATAIAYDLDLVTSNTRHYDDIQGLRLYRYT
ncbi:MAG: type II toxin-antitoxin system VapC family toxin [Chloroflexi bacterium]|nr:type II toxin-antitoxin system VapC family toxin [Chloroflexota bacterium]